MNFRPLVPEENIYLDFIDAFMVRGSKIETNTKHFEMVDTHFKTSFREILSMEMNDEVGTIVAGVGAKTSYKVKSETEFYTEYQKDIKSSLEESSKINIDVAKEGTMGTIMYKVDFLLAKKRITVCLNARFDIWDKESIKEISGENVTKVLYNMAKAKNPDLNLKLISEPTPVVLEPVKGKTCWHVKFQKESFDSCYPDQTHCVEMDGKHFVVCHHNNWEWFGGPGCDCKYIDGLNVILVPATKLDKKHYAYLDEK